MKTRANSTSRVASVPDAERLRSPGEMQSSTSNGPAGVERLQTRDDSEDGDEQSPEVHSAPHTETANGAAETTYNNDISTEIHEIHDVHGAGGQPTEEKSVGNGRPCTTAPPDINMSIPDIDIPGSIEDMPPPEPDLYMAENVLEVDDDLTDEPGESAEPVYAASIYPTVPVHYRVERFDAATINSSSRSLYDEDLDYTMENGRRYCGNYIFPNDDLEQDRMRVIHQVFLNVFNFELTSVPLDDPQYILDVGTGTGEWAIGMGETYPSCEVVGVDISAIQPTAVPHNVFFEVDDCEIDWMRPEDSIDLVHLRDMAGAFTDWGFVYRQAFSCLRPGGYIEVLDFYDHLAGNAAFYNCFPPEAQIHVFARVIDHASIMAGRRRGTHHMNEDVLRRIGYVDIQKSERTIPLNPQSEAIGKLWLIACLHTVEAISLRLLTQYLNWEPSRVFEMCDQVCQELKTRALDPVTADGLNISLRILTARKPTSTSIDTSGASPLYLSPENGYTSLDHSEDESTIRGT